MNRIALSAATCAIALLACTAGVRAEFTLQYPSASARVPVELAEGPSYRYLTLGQTAFQPSEDGPYQLGFNTVGAFAINRAILVSPVQLPDKAVVKQMICHMYDEDYEQDIKCQLVKFRLDDGEFFFIVESRTEVTDHGPVRTVVPVNEEINNLEYSYAVWARPAEMEMEWPAGPYMGIKAITLRYQLAE